MKDMGTELSRRAFNLQVDTWVSRAVDGGVSSFGELLSTLPGVYPTQALDSVKRLRRAKRINEGFASYIERQSRKQPPPLGPLRSALLPPHPLDFEWRFSRSAAKALLTQAVSLAGRGDRVLLLGTPTLAMMAAKEAPRSRYIYIGENNAISVQVSDASVRTPGALETRLCGPDALRAGEAQVVILDPPWYFDFLRPMLRAAAYACKPGGHVLVSLPPIGTNSHVAKDRANILALFAKLSLHLVSVENAAILYDTPYFEANALAAEGCPNIPRAWRHGDLFILERGHEPLALQIANPVRTRQWHEIVIGRMRLFVTRKAVRDGGPNSSLRSIVDGDVLPTVRRADPRRQQAQIWTSGNRIFASARPDLVRLAALAAASGGVFDGELRLSLAEKDTIARLSYTLGELAITEQSEERNGRFEETECLVNRAKSKSAISPNTSRRTRSGANT
jgi:hypothetical protein